MDRTQQTGIVVSTDVHARGLVSNHVEGLVAA